MNNTESFFYKQITKWSCSDYILSDHETVVFYNFFCILELCNSC